MPCKKSLRFVLLCAAAWLIALPTAAQTRSTIAGTLTDTSGGVLPGVAVTLTSPNLVGGPQSATTDARGGYRFSDLPPGTYALKAELPGFQTVERPNLRLLFGTTLTIDMTLGVGGMQEQTVVTAERSPAVDVKTAQATSKVDAELIQSAPIVTSVRDSDDAISSMSPGVNFRSAYGGARSANEVLFDGTPTTLPERQGTNAIVVNPDWVEELQVVGLGASAEYGEFSGSAANFITRSGSNNLHGLVSYRGVPPSWAGNNLGGLPANLQTRFTPAKILTQWDADAHLGGPIARDRLFFFGGYQYLKQEIQAAGTPAPTGTTGFRTIGKLTWAATNTLRIEGTVQPSNIDLAVGPSATSTADVGNNNHEPQTVWTTGASWMAGSKTLLELRLGGLTYQQTIDPKNGGRSGPPSHRDVITGITSVNGNSYRFLDEDRVNIGATATRFLDGRSGRHQMKLGVAFTRMGFRSDQGFPSGLSYQDRNGVPDQVTIWPGDTQRATGRQMVAYLQDRWQPNDRITLEPGIRLTVNRGRTPTAGSVYSTTPVSPRIGVAWDVTSAHRTVVRGHYGRYHEAFGTVEFQFTDTDSQTPQITARVLSDGSFQEISRFTPAGNQSVDPGIKQAYMDQYIAAIEHEIGRDFSLTAQFVDREYKNQFGWLDTGSVYAPVTVQDPGVDGKAGTSDDGATLTAYTLTNPGNEQRLFTNPSGAKRHYRALQLIAQKRYSDHWQFLTAYTRSTAAGNVNNNQGDNYGSLTATNSPFINPNNLINADGRNQLDFPNEFMARGSYRFEYAGGFNVGLNYRYISGQALSRTAVFRLGQGNQVIRVEPRGSLDTDASNTLDLRVDKSMPLGHGVQASVYVDVFNLTNRGFATGYTEASGSSYGVPSGWTTPRTVLISARLTF